MRLTILEYNQRLTLSAGFAGALKPQGLAQLPCQQWTDSEGKWTFIGV